MSIRKTISDWIGGTVDAFSERLVREAKQRVEHEKHGRHDISAADIYGPLDMLISIATSQSGSRDEALRKISTRISQASALEVAGASDEVVQTFLRIAATARISDADLVRLSTHGILVGVTPRSTTALRRPEHVTLSSSNGPAATLDELCAMVQAVIDASQCSRRGLMHAIAKVEWGDER